MEQPAVIYLYNCPYDQKDEAKKLGARWDGGANAKKWYVPEAKYEVLEKFNRWHPDRKKYLCCPYEEKDEAKKVGAKWDNRIKRWYFVPGTNNNEERFAKWLPASIGSNDDELKPPPPPAKKKKVESPTTKKKKTSKASSSLLLPRINPDMTIKQLQVECSARDPSIKGLSNKKKEWLLNHLVIGSVWISAAGATTADSASAASTKGPNNKATPSGGGKPSSSSSAVAKKVGGGEGKKKKTSNCTPATASAKKPKKEVVLTKRAGTQKKKDPEGKKADCSSPTTKKRPVGKSSTTKDSSSTKGTPKKKTKREKGVPNLSSYPRIASSMTIDQLKHELFSRQPTIKGTSNKPKPWFLEQLGIGSVWTSSPEVRGLELADDIVLPKVSSSMTIAQLTHEALERDPTIKGLSGKKKEWFLQHLVIGTIWITSTTISGGGGTTKKVSSTTTTSLSQTSTTTSTTKSATKMMTSTKSTISAAANNSAITSKSKTTTNKKPRDPSPAKKKASNNNKPNKNTNEKDKVVLVASKTKIKKEKEIAPSALNNNKSSNVFSAVKLVHVKLEPEISAVIKGPTKMASRRAGKPVKLEPEISLSSPVSSAVIKGPTKMARRTGQIIKATPAASSNSRSGSASAAKIPVKFETGLMRMAARRTGKPVEQSTEADKTTSNINLKVEPSPSIPVVSAKMTVAQLKEEHKVREPDIKGLSNKGKAWLLDSLGVGTELEGSAEWQTKNDEEATKLHVHCSSICHPHPLADSDMLRVPPGVMGKLGTRTYQKRANVARCNIRHGFLCQEKAFRSCEQCDYDICEACYEIESFPEPEKKKELERRQQERCKQQNEARMKLLEEQKKRDEERRLWRENYERARAIRMEERYGEDLKRFPADIKSPAPKHLDEEKKLKYTVYKADRHRKQDTADKEFDSSYDSLREANLRVEYVYYYEQGSLCKDEIDEYHNEDHTHQDGLRSIECDFDCGGSWSVSAVPSAAWDYMNIDWYTNKSSAGNSSRNDYCFGYFDPSDQEEPPDRSSFAKHICNPSKKNLDKSNMLQYVVWTSCGYDNDYWHSYSGPPEKSFDSSHKSLDNAVRRMEFVFWYNNPWGIGPDEMHVDSSLQTEDGLRRMETCPDDSERWTVSIIPNFAFDYINR